MLNNQDNNKDSTTNSLALENNEYDTIRNGISQLTEREVVEHERDAPLNIKISQKPDHKVLDDDYEYFDRGNLIKFSFVNPDIQKHILTINNNDVITLRIDGWGISLILEQADYVKNAKFFPNISNVKKIKEGHIFSQRIIYKDALRILKKIGYAKESEHISISKEGNKITDYRVLENWVHDKHITICEYIASIININKSED